MKPRISTPTARSIVLPVVLLIALLAAAGAAVWVWQQADTDTPAGDMPTKARPQRPATQSVATEHYLVETSADRERTVRVVAAVESFYRAYSAFFAERIEAQKATGVLRLRLYRDRAEFKANNRSRPWAEAYYLRPVCHAYYAEEEANPYHWMVHEATHQLNAERAGFPKHKWIEEGLGTYFGASRIEDGALIPGSIDPNAYPIWWLGAFVPSGDLERDIAGGRWIPLRALITGKGGPDIDSSVNLHYVQYWSLTHFLFHGENGRYAEAYKHLIAEGGTPENFERLIGPIERIDHERYVYLQRGLKPKPRKPR